MRSTNCKETRRAVEAYVKNEVSDILDRCDEPRAFRPIDTAFNILRDEMEYQRVTRNGRELVGRGIANMYVKSGRKAANYTPAVDPYNVWSLAAHVGCFAVYYDEMRALIAEWLDETPEKAARYSNDKVYELYVHLTAKAFERLHDKDISPRKVDTGYFIQQYEYLNGGHFFDRETLKFFGQTRRSFTITDNHIIKDIDGEKRHCYRVFGKGNIDGYRFSSVHYFDHATFKEITPANDDGEKTSF